MKLVDAAPFIVELTSRLCVTGSIGFSFKYTKKHQTIDVHSVYLDEFTNGMRHKTLRITEKDLYNFTHYPKETMQAAMAVLMGSFLPRESSETDGS